jgi:hypothetical protein
VLCSGLFLWSLWSAVTCCRLDRGFDELRDRLDRQKVGKSASKLAHSNMADVFQAGTTLLCRNLSSHHPKNLRPKLKLARNPAPSKLWHGCNSREQICNFFLSGCR